MKFFTFLVCLFVFSAHALDIDKIKDIHKRYCERKVKTACEALECFNNPEECLEKANAQRENSKDEKVKKLLEKCGEDNHCILDEAMKEKDKALVEMAPKCESGEQEACYGIELINAIKP
jgi:lysyl-tRNA synthetase class I